ncbi:MAG: NUDIX hydrolase [bacterium]|nr:NUDIX hydrolase [bacterium]
MAVTPKYTDLHRVSVTGIVYRSDGKYLITKRSLKKKAFPGKWTVPGGGLDVNDYINTPKTYPGHPQWYNIIEKTLKREILEETNVVVDNLEYLVDLVFIIPDGTPSVVLSYYCRYVSGDVKYDEDTIDHAWVTAEEAKKYDLIEGIAEEIKMVSDILKKRVS